jgi:Pentapeptide repeats (8 copies)
MMYPVTLLSIFLVLFTLLSCCTGFTQRGNIHTTLQRGFIHKRDGSGQFTTSTLALGDQWSRLLPISVFSSQLSKDSNTRHLLSSTRSLLVSFPLVLFVACFVWAFPLAASAEDFAGRDISGQNLSSGNYMQQDFSGAKAAGTNFRNSNLQGCNFNKADLSNADLSGADVRGASFQGSILDGTLFKDVLAAKATFSASILDVKTLENADLTDTLWPSQLQIMICDIPELHGTSSNGVVTRESILCH